MRQKIIIFSRTKKRFCCVMRDLLLTWSWQLLCAFNTDWISVRFGKPGILIFAVWVFRVSYAIFLDIIFNKET
jgi:hypothetical protein